MKAPAWVSRIALAILPALLTTPNLMAAGSDEEFFEKEVRPLLSEQCLKCHGDSRPRGGLRLTSRDSLLKGGDSGPAAVAGKPDESLLIQAIRYIDPPHMPPKKKLSDRQTEILAEWVRRGLPWPNATIASTEQPGQNLQRQNKPRSWAFEPRKVVPPPAVRNPQWVRSELDRFILARLEAKGLRPAGQADRRTLLRRASFDLTGLPPTPEETAAFLKDTRPDAYARVVERLLASPAYGERWGRHWLDLVRYTDSFDARGIGSEGDCAEAWRYRDWVVQAFQRDLPYDQLVTQQIAGDILSQQKGFDRDALIATTFLALGNWGGGDADKEKLLTDIVDDQVDVVSRTFMGLTLACARCHDHKFDPLSTEDYYGLAGIFFSTHILPNVGPKTNGPPMLRIPLISAAELARHEGLKGQVAAAKKELEEAAQRARVDFARSQLEHTAAYLMAAWQYEETESRAGTDVATLARRLGLHPFALKAWIASLKRNDSPLLSTPIRDLLGRTGVHGWKGTADSAALLVNTTSQEQKILTFALPAHAVSLHPGPQSGVAAVWHSPVRARVRIRGRLRDADSMCGDGVAWTLSLGQAGTSRELASGELANGGQQGFQQARGGDRLEQVELKVGDRLELCIQPRGNHICDTTLVELEIATLDGTQVWSLCSDLVDSIRLGDVANPHQDRQGHVGVWSFRESTRPAVPARGWDSALAAWEQSTAAARRSGADRKSLEAAAGAFQKAFTCIDSTSPFWIHDPADEQLLPAVVRADLARRRKRLEALQQIKPPALEYCNGALEGGVPGSPHAGIHDVRVHMRGRYDRLGNLVPRRFPEVLAGQQQPNLSRGSGRLELARWLTQPEHPLTARVMVNRIWQHHFGQGLVATPSNFGKLGRPPSDPALLDHLAEHFVRSGWSIKEMHRQIMLSSTYQQSSIADPETLEKDPENQLFGRMNRRRLEAEAIRDSLLSVCGRLDRTSGGPAVREFRSPRRTLYLMTNRSDRSGYAPLFDTADPTASIDQRTISTVAPQALFLLNHPFILEQTQALTQRILASTTESQARIEQVYNLLYNRPPCAEERRLGLDYLQRMGGTKQAWEEYCQLLLCANEFIYID